MSRGFVAPEASTPMCQYLVAYDTNGRLYERPRPCKRAAAPSAIFCGRHAQIASKRPAVNVREGGFCVWCAEPARSFVDPVSGVTIALCRPHGLSLARAIREGR